MAGRARGHNARGPPTPHEPDPVAADGVRFAWDLARLYRMRPCPMEDEIIRVPSIPIPLY